MVSEDSDYFTSGLLAIHRLSDLDDLNQPFTGQMMTAFDQLDTLRELLKVFLLRGVHRVSLEEWNYHFQQILPLSDNVTIQVLFVVIVPSVNQYLTHTEELIKFVQAGDAFRTLRDRELMSHLKAGSVAFTTSPIWLSDEPDGEASFPVYKTYNPAALNQSFLLIACT